MEGQEKGHVASVVCMASSANRRYLGLARVAREMEAIRRWRYAERISLPCWLFLRKGKIREL